MPRGLWAPAQGFDATTLRGRYPIHLDIDTNALSNAWTWTAQQTFGGGVVVPSGQTFTLNGTMSGGTITGATLTNVDVSGTLSSYTLQSGTLTGTLTGGTGATLSGTFAGNPTFSGAPSFSTIAGNPSFSAGLTVPSGQILTLGGTLSGGTISGSTISGGTLSGTIGGSPTFSGLPSFSSGLQLTAIADSSTAGKLFLSSTTANTLKYYDTQSTPALHTIATLDMAQTFTGAQTFGELVTAEGGLSTDVNPTLVSTLNGSSYNNPFIYSHGYIINDITGARWMIHQGYYRINFAQETTTAGAFTDVIAIDTGQAAGVGKTTYLRGLTSNPLVLTGFSSVSVLADISSTGSLYASEKFTGQPGASVVLQQLSLPSNITATVGTSGAVGGYLSANTTYYYTVTAVAQDGSETNAPAVVQANEGATAYPITISWAGVPYAVSYNIYKAEGNSVPYFLTNVTGTSYVDTGNVGTTAKTPPMYNGTASANIAGPIALVGGQSTAGGVGTAAIVQYAPTLTVGVGTTGTIINFTPSVNSMYIMAWFSDSANGYSLTVSWVDPDFGQRSVSNTYGAVAMWARAGYAITLTVSNPSGNSYAVYVNAVLMRVV